MTNMSVGTSSAAVASKDAKGSVGTNVKTWTAVFIFTSLALIALQPTAIITGTTAIALMVAMAMIVHISVVNFGDEVIFDAKQQFVAVIAPAQFACLIWMAVHTGRMIIDTTLVTSSLAAFMALAFIVLIDAFLSAAILRLAERGKNVSGISFAALISSKYAGLLGKIA